MIDHATPNESKRPLPAVRKALAIWLPIAVFAVFLIAAPHILLMVFLGLLVAVFFRMGGNSISRWFGIGGGWGLAIYVLVLASLAALFFLYAANGLSHELDQLLKTLPKARDQVTQFTQQHRWAGSIVSDLNLQSFVPSSAGAAATMMTSAGLLANAALVLFLGIYAAIDPKLYRHGIAVLFPASRRDWVVALCATGWAALSGWLFAQMMSMAVIGGLTFLGLWALGVPLAPILAVLAALLTFIPNLGPVMAAIPAMAMGLTIGPGTMLWVAGLYIAVQALESNLITPQIQQKAMSLPPVLVIAFQLLMGSLFGMLGLALATPLLAVLLNAIRRHYLPLIGPDDL